MKRVVCLVVWVLMLASCQMGARYADFWSGDLALSSGQSDADFLQALAKDDACLSVGLKNGALVHLGGQPEHMWADLDGPCRGYYCLDLSYTLSYDESLGWCLAELACEGLRGLNLGRSRVSVSDAAAAALFRAAAVLPCMRARSYPQVVLPGGSDQEELFEASLCRLDAERGHCFFVSKGTEGKESAFLDLLIEMRRAMGSVKSKAVRPLELSLWSFDALRAARLGDMRLGVLFDWSPLMLSVVIDNEAMSKRLMSKGMKTGYILDFVDVCNVYGKSALHYACRFGRSDVVVDLLACGANVDAVDDLGDTPLFLAVCYGHRDIVELLISAGADLNHRDEFNRSALMRCRQLRDEAMAQLLIEAGAR